MPIIGAQPPTSASTLLFDASSTYADGATVITPLGWTGTAIGAISPGAFNARDWLPVGGRYVPACQLWVPSASAFRRLPAARARAIAGRGVLHIAEVGDSTVQSYLGTAPYTPNGWPEKARIALNTDGSLGAIREGWVPMVTPPLNADTRVVLSGTWNTNVGGYGPGGGTVYESHEAGAYIEFTPGYSTDRCTFLMVAQAGSTFSTGIDGVETPVGAATAAQANTLVAITVGTTPGAHTYRIKATTTGQGIYVMAVRAYTNTGDGTGIMVSKFGVQGTSSNGSSAGWTGISAAAPAAGPLVSTFDYFRPDLVGILLGANDAPSPMSKAAYKANIGTMVDRARANGADVILRPSFPVGNPTNDGYLLQYQSALYELARELNVAVQDVRRRWGSYAAKSATSYADSVHPNQTGYDDMATMVTAGWKDVLTAAAI